MKMIRYISIFLFLLYAVSPVYPEAIKNYNSLLSEGVIKLNSGEVSEAIPLFEQAVKEDPQGVEAYYYIGVAQARTNLVAEAEASFKLALALDPLFIPAHFDLGVLYYSQGSDPSQGTLHQNKSNDEAALASFDIVQKTDPDRARVYFYQGLILRRLEKYKEAAAKLEEAAQRDPALAQEAYHQAGEAYLQANDIAASKNALQKVITIDPETVKAKEAQDFLKNLDVVEITQRHGKQWRFSLLTGVLYDDNVILEPQGAAYKTSDTIVFVRLRGGFQFTPNKSAEYSFYQNNHLNKSFQDYDIQDHHFSLNVHPLRFQDRLNVGYQIQIARLGNEHYLTYHTLETQYLLLKSDTKVTELSYQFQVKRYYNIEPLFPTSKDRNALGHQIGIRHAVLLDSDINLRGSYFFELDRAGSNALEDDWSFTGHRLKSGITLPAWHKITPAVDLEYIFRPYDNENEFSPSANRVKRRDQGYLFSLTLSHPLGEHVQVVFSYLYQRNDANIAMFDYNRAVYGLLAVGRF